MRRRQRAKNVWGRPLSTVQAFESVEREIGTLGCLFDEAFPRGCGCSKIALLLSHVAECQKGRQNVFLNRRVERVRRSIEVTTGCEYASDLISQESLYMQIL